MFTRSAVPTKAPPASPTWMQPTTYDVPVTPASIVRLRAMLLPVLEACSEMPAR